jgi:hypothetical protein
MDPMDEKIQALKPRHTHRNIKPQPKHLIRKPRPSLNFFLFHFLPPCHSLLFYTINMSGYRLLLTTTARTNLRPVHQVTAVRHYSSPLRVFMDTIKEQLNKNKEVQQGVKSLQDESGKFADSEALKRAKEMFEKAKVKKEQREEIQKSQLTPFLFRCNKAPLKND